MNEPLKPGAWIGILGGGQLGRMLSVAASRLGYRCHVYEPGAAPAGDVAARLTTAAYDDEAAIRAFAGSVDNVSAYLETSTCLAQGNHYVWLEPQNANGVPGPVAGPFAVTIK